VEGGWDDSCPQICRYGKLKPLSDSRF
jgi:hypothetical protein